MSLFVRMTKVKGSDCVWICVCTVCALNSGASHRDQMPVVVETVTKSSTIKTFAAAQPQHDSDASRVTSKGVGLQSAQLNRDATFAVDASRAGLLIINHS